MGRSLEADIDLILRENMKHEAYQFVDGRLILTSAVVIMWLITAVLNCIKIYHASNTPKIISRKAAQDPSKTIDYSRKALHAICIRYFGMLDIAIATFNAVVLIWTICSSSGSAGIFEEVKPDCENCVEDRRQVINLVCVVMEVRTAGYLLGLACLAFGQAVIRYLLFVSGIDHGLKHPDSFQHNTNCRKYFLLVGGLCSLTLTLPLFTKLDPGLTKSLLGHEPPKLCLRRDSVHLTPYMSMLFSVLLVALMHLLLMIENAWHTHAEILLRQPLPVWGDDDDADMIDVGNSDMSIADEVLLNCAGQNDDPTETIYFRAVSSREHALFLFRSVTYPLLAVGFNPWIVWAFLPNDTSITTSVIFYFVQLIYTLMNAFYPRIWRVRKLLGTENEVGSRT